MLAPEELCWRRCQVDEHDPIMRVKIEHHDNDMLEYDRTSDEIKAYTNEIMLTMRGAPTACACCAAAKR